MPRGRYVFEGRPFLSLTTGLTATFPCGTFGIVQWFYKSDILNVECAMDLWSPT